MKQREKTPIEMMYEELEIELAEIERKSAELHKKWRAADEKGDAEQAEKLQRQRMNINIRAEELRTRITWADEHKSKKLADEKVVSDMWANRLNVGGHLLIGGAGLYLGYKADKNGSLTNKSPIGFFNTIFGGLTRRNV